MKAVNYTRLNAAQRKEVRLQYVEHQKGLCSHCGFDLRGPASGEVLKHKIDKSLFPFGFFNNGVHLHHSHVTGMTIGAVHARCNAYLWQYLGE